VREHRITQQFVEGLVAAYLANLVLHRITLQLRLCAWHRAVEDAGSFCQLLLGQLVGSRVLTSPPKRRSGWVVAHAVEEYKQGPKLSRKDVERHIERRRFD